MIWTCIIYLNSLSQISSVLFLLHVAVLPVFAAPDAAEDDGYLLSFLNDWSQGVTDFVVFDAKDITKGTKTLTTNLLRPPFPSLTATYQLSYW